MSNDIESVWMAERFAAAAQAMLAALAREELCLVQSQINVRIENRLQIQTPGTEPIESLPSNDGRRWVIRLMPIEGSNAVDPQETAIELLAMLMMIIREVSLLPEDDSSKAMDKAFQRGLGHKLCCQSGGREPGHGPRQRGLNTKLHLAVDAHGMPVRMLLTAGAAADCTQGLALIASFTAEYLLADKGYDTNQIVAMAAEWGMQVVIPPRSNRREQREYDRDRYQARHLVENGFCNFKQWRGMATRYAKKAASFLANCQIRAFPSFTLAETLVQEPAGAAQERDQPAYRRGGYLP